MINAWEDKNITQKGLIDLEEYSLLYLTNYLVTLLGHDFWKFVVRWEYLKQEKKKKKSKQGEPEQQIYKTATWYRYEMWTDSRT